MSDTPERIWAVTEPGDISADILGEVYAQQIPDGMNGTPVEYVRADRIEELEAKLAKAVEALGEAIYLLDPDEEDIAKETGLHRIVTTYAELTSSEAAYGEAKGGKDE